MEFVGYVISFLCLIIITMLAAYFVRENENRKEQRQTNKEVRDAMEKMTKSIDTQTLINHNLTQSYKDMFEWRESIEDIIDMYKKEKDK